MLVQHRSSLVPALLAFAEAAGETPSSQAWTLGWPTAKANDTPENYRESDLHTQSNELDRQLP
jgi:hypothetical protein